MQLKENQYFTIKQIAIRQKKRIKNICKVKILAISLWCKNKTTNIFHNIFSILYSDYYTIPPLIYSKKY